MCFSFYYCCVTSYHQLSNLKQLIYYLPVSVCWECGHALAWYSASEPQPSCHQAISCCWVSSEAQLRKNVLLSSRWLAAECISLRLQAQGLPRLLTASCSFLSCELPLTSRRLPSHSQQGKERLFTSLLRVLGNGIESLWSLLSYFVWSEVSHRTFLFTKRDYTRVWTPEGGDLGSVSHRLYLPSLLPKVEL